MEIIANPDFDAYYCSYYLRGIFETFGPRAIRWRRGAFPKMRQAHSLSIILPPEGRKIFIDAQDSCVPFRDALAWCDVYAKINVDPDVRGGGAIGRGGEGLDAGEAPGKIMPIGPSFGLRIWGSAVWATLAAANYVRSSPARKGYRGSREHFANYWRQYHYRLPIEAYTHEPSRGDYIFFLSPVWKQEPRCNEYRASFIKACRSLRGVSFEGGFAPRRREDVRGFEDFAVERRYPLPVYIAKLKRSLVAFNTPAVYGCLGWKLAEYLALGKAIVSTPLGRALPAPLEHGRHVHFVDGSFEEIARAVELIASDAAYRRELENNAREYFLRHLAPAKCVERIVTRAASG